MRWAVWVAMVACGGASASTSPSTSATAPSGDTARAVPLGEWCSSLTQLMCIRAGSCIGSLEITTSCKETAQESCLAGRAAASPSGHVASELDACEKTFQNAPCDGYMGAVAAHTECQAHAP